MKRPFKIIYSDAYGSLVNGQWTGITGLLVNNESDFSTNIAEVKYERYCDKKYTDRFIKNHTRPIR